MNGLGKNTIYLNLDPYLDVNGLLKLKSRVIAEISKCFAFIMHGTTGTGNNKLDNKINDLKKVSNYLLNSNQLTAELQELTNIQREYALKYIYPNTTMGYQLSLRYVKDNVNWSQKNKKDNIIVTPIDKNFKFIYDWLDKQNIFEEIGRVIFFLSNPYHGGQIHTDYPDLLGKPNNVKDEFLWIRFDKRKNFFIYDESTHEKFYMDGYVNFFNNKDYHGSDPSELHCFSLRIDGIFKDEFKNKSPVLLSYFNHHD